MAHRCLVALIAAAWAINAGAADPARGSLAGFKVVGDGIPEAIGGATGDANRGRSLMLLRDPANCIVCHALPGPGLRFAGNLGPPLDGVARDLTIAQLRLRVVDSMLVRPATIMPSYYRIDGFDRVAGAYQGQPILDATQVEDIVAYLATLK
jgi:L-cysteine S-thiosulfotransferase